MYSVAISVGAGLLLFILLTATGLLSWYASILPATIVMLGLMFVIARRVNTAVTAEVAGIAPLLQAQDVDGAQALIRSIQQRFGKWQLYLDGQLESQLGMIDYMQGKFDDAFPKLKAGEWRNPYALICIGCIHFRRSEREAAWASFTKAQEADPKESMSFLVHAVLRANAGDREEALKVIGAGLAGAPANAALTKLQATVANKKKIDVKQLPPTWYNFFPEDAVRPMLVRGRKGPPPPGAPVAPQPRFGARSAPRK